MLIYNFFILYRRARDLRRSRARNHRTPVPYIMLEKNRDRIPSIARASIPNPRTQCVAGAREPPRRIGKSFGQPKMREAEGENGGARPAPGASDRAYAPTTQVPPRWREARRARCGRKNGGGGRRRVVRNRLSVARGSPGKPPAARRAHRRWSRQGRVVAAKPTTELRLHGHAQPLARLLARLARRKG